MIQISSAKVIYSVRNRHLQCYTWTHGNEGRFLLPTSHELPVYPGAQEQAYDVELIAVQLSWYLHGFDRQGSIRNKKTNLNISLHFNAEQLGRYYKKLSSTLDGKTCLQSLHLKVISASQLIKMHKHPWLGDQRPPTMNEHYSHDESYSTFLTLFKWVKVLPFSRSTVAMIAADVASTELRE